MINSRELKRDDRAGNQPLDDRLDETYRIGPSEPRPAFLSAKMQGWAWWILSVLCTSVLLSNVHYFDFSNIRPIFDGAFWKGFAAGECSYPLGGSGDLE